MQPRLRGGHISLAHAEIRLGLLVIVGRGKITLLQVTDALEVRLPIAVLALRVLQRRLGREHRGALLKQLLLDVRQIRLGILEIDLVVAVVDGEEQIAFLDRLVVTHIDLSDQAAHLRRDIDDIRPHDAVASAQLLIVFMDGKDNDREGDGEK